MDQEGLAHPPPARGIHSRIARAQDIEPGEALGLPSHALERRARRLGYRSQLPAWVAYQRRFTGVQATMAARHTRDHLIREEDLPNLDLRGGGDGAPGGIEGSQQT